METQLDYNGSVEDAREETANQSSTDETITKLSQLEKVYEEKKKVKKCLIISPLQNLFVFPQALLSSIQ